MGLSRYPCCTGYSQVLSTLTPHPSATVTEILLLLLGVALLFFGVIYLIATLLRIVFQGVAKVGGGLAYHGVRAVAGDAFAAKHEQAIRGAGAALGLVGGVLLVGEAVDVDLGGAEDTLSGEAMLAGVDLSSAEAIGEIGASAGAIGIDLDGDGIIDGFDTNGDGVLDTNVLGHPVGGLESVQGYTRADGTPVAGYTRTVADGSPLNNLRPLR